MESDRPGRRILVFNWLIFTAPILFFFSQLFFIGIFSIQEAGRLILNPLVIGFFMYIFYSLQKSICNLYRLEKSF